MILHGYSNNHETTIEKRGRVLHIKPSGFKQFVQEAGLPDFVSSAVPGYVKPDINSNRPEIALPTWEYLITLYFDILGESGPYTFFADNAEVDDEEEFEDYIY